MRCQRGFVHIGRDIALKAAGSWSISRARESESGGLRRELIRQLQRRTSGLTGRLFAPSLQDDVFLGRPWESEFGGGPF